MVSMTLAVPEELREEMENFPEINWSAVAREAIKKKLVMLEKFRKFTKTSEMTDKEALKMGRKLKRKLAKKYR
ncbi:MAG: hypothetical protein KAT43_03605 [Nanoarchaeota archaeon]|nr:hypothetical protein [Nanoarchaeota archaeon]